MIKQWGGASVPIKDKPFSEEKESRSFFDEIE